MSRAARSVLVFAGYLAVLGLVLIFVPNRLLSLFGIPATNDIWIRVVGVLVINIGIYFWVSAVRELRPMMVASVVGRLAVLVWFIGFVWLADAQPTLLLFAAGDTAGAIWTWWALRQDTRHPVLAR